MSQPDPVQAPSPLPAQDPAPAQTPDEAPKGPVTDSELLGEDSEDSGYTEGE